LPVAGADDGDFDGVFQLADVARPGARHQVGFGARLDMFGGQPVAACQRLKKKRFGFEVREPLAGLRRSGTKRDLGSHGTAGLAGFLRLTQLVLVTMVSGQKPAQFAKPKTPSRLVVLEGPLWFQDIRGSRGFGGGVCG
jgi:hypothetical protein